MAPPKKSSENQNYCIRYREKNCTTYRKNDAERKRPQREKVKLLNPELYELKKKEERERKQLFTLRKKLNPLNQTSARSESPGAANNNATNITPSTSFRQSKKELEVSTERKKCYPRTQGRKPKSLVLCQRSINFAS